MANTVELNKEESNIQGFIGQYLAERPTDLDFASNDTSHIDQDTLSAFAEGSLNKRESTPVVGHLVRCSFCRHITAELVRLDFAFAEAPAAQPTRSEAPGKISEVLSGLFSKIFGTSDGAVFAHTEDEAKNKDEKDKEDEESAQ